MSSSGEAYSYTQSVFIRFSNLSIGAAYVIGTKAFCTVHKMNVGVQKALIKMGL